MPRWLSIFLLVVRRGVLVLLQATLALFPVRAVPSDWTATSAWAGDGVEEPNQVRQARKRAARAKVRELAAYRRAAELHEEAAKLQERTGHGDLAHAARERAHHARERHAEPLREQAEADEQAAAWDGR
jgi:hypothetical protein